MNTTEKLIQLKGKKDIVKIMIMGLGSVGQYLLDYLCSMNDERIEIIVAGRNRDKMIQDVNIVKVAASIRGTLRTHISIVDGCDLSDIDSIRKCLSINRPDIVVNTSRVYVGLKYGSISWNNFRAYGIWTPLSIEYIKNIIRMLQSLGLRAPDMHTRILEAEI